MPNLLRIKLAEVELTFFFILLNNPVEKRTKATIGWNIQDCPLVFYFNVLVNFVLIKSNELTGPEAQGV